MVSQSSAGLSAGVPRDEVSANGYSLALISPGTFLIRMDTSLRLNTHRRKATNAAKRHLPTGFTDYGKLIFNFLI